jgi:flagellar protein FliS
MGALDMEIGGKLAKNLFRVYEFWHHELVMANMQKDPKRVERLLPYFKSYRATWQKAIAQFKAERAQAQLDDSAAGAGSSFASVG